jgi:hypothetical protein
LGWVIPITEWDNWDTQSVFWVHLSIVEEGLEDTEMQLRIRLTHIYACQSDFGLVPDWSGFDLNPV